ncbi:NUMOD4 domain-containing protein [Lacticaseibacillus paracasei]|nr:NUMOD4 domain-containing protein [Lacticaseibacillus paracasei]
MSSTEVWKDIEGFEGLYQVSNMGRVRSLDRKDKNGQFRNGRVLADKHNNRGYHMIALCRDGNAKYRLIHRLVAIAFLNNPDSLPEVNHKDENKANNAVSNLEWCTSEYNLNYGTRKYRIAKSSGPKHKTNYCNDPKQIIATNMTTGVSLLMPSLHEAGKKLGIDFRQISAVIRGKQNTAHGYRFELLGVPND